MPSFHAIAAASLYGELSEAAADEFFRAAAATSFIAAAASLPAAVNAASFTAADAADVAAKAASVTASDAATDAADAVNAASFTAADAAELDIIWRSTAGDCAAIEAGASASELMRSPLWPEDGQGPFHDRWTDMVRDLRGRDQQWEVWIDWYEDRLVGLDHPRARPIIPRLERARVMAVHDLIEDDELPDAAVVNARLAELEALHRIPEQAGAPRFRIGNDNRIEADAAGLDLDGADRNRLETVHPQLVRLAVGLHSTLSKTNAHPELSDNLSFFLVEIDRPLSDPGFNFEAVAAAGLGLQNWLDASIANQADEASLEPMLETGPLSSLKQLVALQGPFVLATREGREFLEDVDHYGRSREQDTALKESAVRFAEQVDRAGDLFEESARNIVRITNAGLGDGNAPERMGLLAQRSNSNLLGHLATIATGTIGGVAATVVTQSAAGAEMVSLANSLGQSFPLLAGRASAFLLECAPVLREMAIAAPSTLGWIPALLDLLKR